VTHDVIVILAVLGVVGQVLGAGLLLVGALALFGVRGPLRALRSGVEGYELWLAFLVAAIATGGSLFFSEIAHFVPCELCWYQRICMYPLSIVTLLAALFDDPRVARYLLPLPVGGADSPASGTVPTRGSLTNALPDADAVQREFAGIPQHGLVLGSPKAPL